MSLLNEFIDYLKHEVEVHSIYVIGAQGRRGKEVTEEWIRYRERENQRNADRAVNFWKKQVAAGYGDVLGAFDCSGLGMYWLQNVRGIYPSDLNANGMYSKCSTKLTKEQLKKGDWVFVDTNGRKTHIGYIVDDNLTVVEARGRDYGVVSGKLDSRWTHFGRPDCFKDEIEGGTSSMSINIVVTRNLKKDYSGEDVKALQTYLNRFNYGLAVDGKFGTKTYNAVKDFQAKHNLTSDGIAGKNTIAALDMIWGKGKTDEAILAELNELAYNKTLEVDKVVNDSNKISIALNDEIANLKKQLENTQNQLKITTNSLNKANEEKSILEHNLNESIDANNVITDKINQIKAIVEE